MFVVLRLMARAVEPVLGDAERHRAPEVRAFAVCGHDRARRAKQKEMTLPVEHRARPSVRRRPHPRQFGMGTKLARILILEQDLRPGRTTVILVRESNKSVVAICVLVLIEVYRILAVGTRKTRSRAVPPRPGSSRLSPTFSSGSRRHSWLSRSGERPGLASGWWGWLGSPSRSLTMWTA